MAKKRSMILIVALVVVYTFCFQATMVEAAKMPINVLHKGKDEVGIRLAYQIKEHIRNSKAYRLSSTDEPRLEIFMTTFDLADELANSVRNSNKNFKSVVSVIITMINSKRDILYVNGLLGTVGSSEVKERAETILAMIDNM